MNTHYRVHLEVLRDILAVRVRGGKRFGLDNDNLLEMRRQHASSDQTGVRAPRDAARS
jgi:hypothetical protein